MQINWEVKVEGMHVAQAQIKTCVVCQLTL